MYRRDAGVAALRELGMGWCHSTMCGAAPTAAENITVPGMRNLVAQLADEHHELDVVDCFSFSWLFCVTGKGPSGVLGWNI